MEFTSDLAQVWIKYCLLMITGAKAQSDLNQLAEIINGDITMLFETEQIDEDERAWAVKAVNDALYERAEDLRNALKEPPKHEH
jgi:hypothetical protein